MNLNHQSLILHSQNNSFNAKVIAEKEAKIQQKNEENSYLKKFVGQEGQSPENEADDQYMDSDEDKQEK